MAQNMRRDGCPVRHFVRNYTNNSITKGVSALEPDSIRIDFTLQSTSYETGSIHFDRVRTTNLTRCDCAQGPLLVHVIGRALIQ